MSLKTIAVIPVHGRLPLLKITLQRLYERNGVGHIICIGDSDEERAVCNSQGAEFIKYDNKPLGRKWNAGYLKAKEYKPDAVAYVGSSDWLSDNWLNVLLPYSEYGFCIVGKRDFNLLHIHNTGTLICSWWPHYPQDGRRDPNELIGIGRILSREFLDKIEWKPFDDYLNNSMDGSMWNKLAVLWRDDKIDKPVYDHNLHIIQSLSISCDAWENMHINDFELAVPITCPELWLKTWFPEALNLKL